MQKKMGLFFLILSCVPMLFIFLAPMTNVSEYENRNLSQAPRFSWNSFMKTDFQTQFNSYLNDHFPLRADFIRIYNWVKKESFRFNPVRDCIIGKDSWLYYGHPIVLDYFTTDPGFTAEQVQNILQKQKDRYEELKKMGIEYVVLIAPHKESIYPEFLPAWYEGQLKKLTRLDHLLNSQQNLKTPVIIDLRSLFLKEKQNDKVFFQTDTHWNFKGALLGTLSFLNILRDKSYKIPALSENDYDVSADKYYGDLARMQLLPQDQYQEESKHYQLKNKITKSPYKLYAITDSFGGYTQEYLKDIFQDYQHSALADGDNAIMEKIKKDKPDIVLLLITERQLIGHPFYEKAW